MKSAEGIKIRGDRLDSITRVVEMLTQSTQPKCVEAQHVDRKETDERPRRVTWAREIAKYETVCGWYLCENERKIRKQQGSQVGRTS